MKTLLMLGVGIFITGAIVAILDLLEVFTISWLHQSFPGALALMIIGITIIFFAQARDKKNSH